MVLDEADQILLDRTLWLKAEYCVGLTATPFVKLEGTECEYLSDWLGFKVYDSGIVSPVSKAELVPVDSVE